jgi:hypothetical protein
MTSRISRRATLFVARMPYLAKAHDSGSIKLEIAN